MSKKQNMTPTNEFGQKHGLWISYYNDGNLMSKLRWVDGIRYGIKETYISDGKTYSRNYIKYDKLVYSEWFNNNKIIFYI